ncbi:MAG: hypothetical protein KZQ83_02230 [gamma proteobacterium symbiont of Taylorina sp.]|nr:hypothetical protein [gamma proteobacterium symbiont of Taylorina sp.]
MSTKVVEEKSLPDDTNIAILAESLFLANLLLIPVIPFVVLFSLYRKHKLTIKSGQESLAYNHIRQTFIASILAGVLIVCVVGVFYFLSNISAAVTWTIIITYFTCVHSLFVMYGIYGLAKAMGGQPVKFPLIA